MNKETISEKLNKIKELNWKNQPPHSEIKNRLIFDSYKPMHLIIEKDKKGF